MSLNVCMSMYHFCFLNCLFLSSDFCSKLFVGGAWVCTVNVLRVHIFWFVVLVLWGFNFCSYFFSPDSNLFIYFFSLFFVVAGIKRRASHMLVKCSTTEQYFQPFYLFFIETESHWIAQAGFKFVNLLPHPAYWLAGIIGMHPYIQLIDIF